MKDALKKNGYDNEEVYFAKVNRELIDKIQEKEDRKKEAKARGFRVIEGGGGGGRTRTTTTTAGSTGAGRGTGAGSGAGHKKAA